MAGCFPELLFAWFLCGVISYALLNPFKRGGLGLAVGLVFGPLGIVYAFVERSNLQRVETQERDRVESDRQANELRACPFCAEKIQRKAKVCRFCGRDVEPVTPSS